MKSIALLLLPSATVFAHPLAQWPGKSAETTVGARASLSPDGPWLPSASKGNDTLQVHDDSGARPQFVEHAAGADLVLYADGAALQTFTASGADLFPTVAAAKQPLGDRTPGWHLRPGTKVDKHVTDSDGLSQVHIAFRWGNGAGVTADGYVASARLGKVYSITYETPAAYVPNVTLPGNHRLLDAPKGTPFMTSTNTQRVEAMTLDRKSGHTLVRVPQGAVGWIASSQTKAIPKTDEEGVEGGEEGGVAGGYINVSETLPVGTVLRDAIDGVVIGDVTGGFTGVPVKQEDRQGKPWWRYDIKTRFGTVQAWTSTAPTSRKPR